MIVATFSLVATAMHGQTDTINKQNLLIKKLCNTEKVKSEHIGKAGTPSKTDRTAKSLWDISSIPTLLKFTNDKNPIVRYYTFLELMEKRADKKLIRETVAKQKNDTTKVTTMNGYIVWESDKVVPYMHS